MEKRIKYQHLRCFLAIYRLRSVGRAADELGISQPAASRKLKELEDMLGTRLLVRNNQAVELTAAGSLFVRHATDSLNALENGLSAIQHLRSSSTRNARTEPPSSTRETTATRHSMTAQPDPGSRSWTF